jgi:hypothetical protein
VFLNGRGKNVSFLDGRERREKKTPSKKREKIVFFIFKSEKKNRKTGNKNRKQKHTAAGLSLFRSLM